MTLAEFLERAAVAREARTQRMRHGEGVLTLLDGVPVRAAGVCYLTARSPMQSASCRTSRRTKHVGCEAGAFRTPSFAAAVG